MRKPLHLLVVEDSPDDAELMVAELERGGYDVSFERVQTAHAMQASLTRTRWDLVVSDYEMPTFSGPAALEVLKASGWTCRSSSCQGPSARRRPWQRSKPARTISSSRIVWLACFPRSSANSAIMSSAGNVHRRLRRSGTPSPSTAPSSTAPSLASVDARAAAIC